MEESYQTCVVFPEKCESENNKTEQQSNEWCAMGYFCSNTLVASYIQTSTLRAIVQLNLMVKIRN